MIRSALLGVAALTCLAPAVARAALQVRFEQLEVMPGSPGTYEVDVFAVPTDNEDEQLAVYEIGFLLEPINPSPGQGALSFAPPYATRPAEGFVFGDDPATFVVRTTVPPGAGPGWFLINVEAAPGTALRDITGPVKLATVHVAFDPGAWRPGRGYHVRIDEETTGFGSGDPRRLDPTITYVAEDMVMVVPEPSAAAVLGLAGVAALGRRRRAVG